MRTKENQIPLIRNFQPHAGMFVRRNTVITQQDFLEDLSRLVTAFKKGSPASYLVNVCEDRYYFTLVFCAGLVCGFTNLLPQDRQPETIRKLSETYMPLITIADCPCEMSQENHCVADLLQAVESGEKCMPLVAESHLAAIAFTSGSTGAPQPNTKYWKMLCGTTEKLAQRLMSNLGARPTIVATVPSQHMYGLEMTVMMALQGDCVIHTEKPFFPDDIVETINALPGTTVLVTTPAHLRVLLASGLQLPHVARIVSATAPLSRAIACDAELKMQTTLEELYGCTEAGATATRRTTQDDDWHLLEGMRFFQTMTNGGDETQVHGDHLPEAACLQDILKLESETRFKLVGRSGDMINVGGKRASLANLNQLLLAIDGIEDGVVYFSASGERDGALRPAAFVVTSLPEQEVLKAMAKSMDPVFLPRPLIKVEKIPRNETGKIIREQLLAMQKN